MPLVTYYIQFRYVKYYDCKLFLLEKEKKLTTNISSNLIKVSEASVFALQICFMLLTVCLLLERLDAKFMFYFFSFYILI